MDGLLAALPVDLQERIHYGLYGGDVQYYISGVDGTLATLGPELRWGNDRLREIVTNADKEHAILVSHHDKANAVVRDGVAKRSHSPAPHC